MQDAIRRQLVARPALLATAANLFARPRGLGVRLAGTGVRRSYAVTRDDREIRLSLRHGRYLGVVIAQFDDFHGAVKPISDGRRDVADFSAPAWHRLREVDEDFYLTSLPEERGANDVYLRAFAIRPGEKIFDVGGYCGLTAYRFARATGAGGKVVCVEADPEHLATISQNLARHEVANVAVVHAALWRECGTLAFATEGTLDSAIASLAVCVTETVSVRATTLAELVKDTGTVYHVKLDIEGAEYDALESGADFFKNHRPDVVLELHRDASGRVNAERMRAIFDRFAYDVRTLGQPGGILPILHARPRESAA